MGVTWADGVKSRTSLIVGDQTRAKRSPLLCQACLTHARGCMVQLLVVVPSPRAPSSCWGDASIVDVACIARMYAFKSICPPHFNMAGGGRGSRPY